MNVNKLKGKIVEHGMKIGDLASVIGIDRSSFYRKLNEMEKFTIGEAGKIRNALCICDADMIEIFFSEKSHEMPISN